ncbi:hypothetical protein ACFC57_10790 [Enterococcus hirae]|uniref:hypothetical protein n=1 Tax=Enterococcus hirae TaxID=1354 RepID=UPI0019E44270|nr:hypothetical protein [Enterococcus hirae]EMF0207648.1 hypothetical protein [Enterococcus hirae]EMF0225150.1 hypothetical protein [Enterococcus hirae]
MKGGEENGSRTINEAGNVSEELAVLNNEHSLNASLDTICGTMGSLGCGSFGCGSLSSCC